MKDSKTLEEACRRAFDLSCERDTGLMRGLELADGADQFMLLAIHVTGALSPDNPADYADLFFYNYVFTCAKTPALRHYIMEHSLAYGLVCKEEIPKMSDQLVSMDVWVGHCRDCDWRTP